MFPFDKQKCDIRLFMPEFDPEEMILVLDSNIVYIDESGKNMFVEISEFQFYFCLC